MQIRTDMHGYGQSTDTPFKDVPRPLSKSFSQLKNIGNRSGMVSLTSENNIKTVRDPKRTKGLIFAWGTPLGNR